MRRALPVLLLATLLATLLCGRASADELRSDLAARHVALARKLDRSGCFVEARSELLLALELDPDAAGAREKLGYERDGEGWKGSPVPARPSKLEVPAALGKEREALHALAAANLAQAAERAPGAEQRALAGLALDEDREEKAARALLHHVKKSGAWVSPREAEVRDAFARSLAEARANPPAEVAGDAELEKLLDLGPLARRESEHAVFLATRAASTDLLELARTIDTVRRAWYRFLPQRAAAGEAPRKTTGARWLVVAPAEHEKFLARAVPDKARQGVAKQLRSWSGWIQLPGSDERTFVYECSLAPGDQVEWAALTAVKTLVPQALARGVVAPGFLVEGFARFFSGRATGRIGITFVSTKSTLSVRERTARGFEDFRAGVREALAGSLEGDLARLVGKSLNELEPSDSERSLAFVEHALATRPEALRAFVAALTPDETPLATLERTFGMAAARLEREQRAWVREEY